MPVQETADAADELAALGIPIGQIIVNQTHPPLLPNGRISQAQLKKGLAAAGLPADRDLVNGVYAEAKAYQIRQHLEDTLRADLTALGRPVIELPLLPGGVDKSNLGTLVAALAAAM
ncbi:MAG TPA: ATPase, partial [Rugosimonospora sp.]|nr:ATPase [Rugosimonospora sp.]